MKNSLWFQHDGNARKDVKLQLLIKKYNLKGYGLYWYLVEEIFESNEEEIFELGNLEYISLLIDIPIEEIQEMLAFMIKIGLFQTDSETLQCKSLEKRTAKIKEKNQEISDKRAEAGRKGAEARWNKNSKTEAKESNRADSMANDGKTKQTIASDDNEKQSMAYKIREDKIRLDNNMPDSAESMSSASLPVKEKPAVKNKEPETYEKIFEQLWKLYPRKLGKGRVTKKAKKHIAKQGVDKFMQALENYKRDIKRNQTEERYIKHGSTFFNSDWEDWLEVEAPKTALKTARGHKPFPDDY